MAPFHDRNPSRLFEDYLTASSSNAFDVTKLMGLSQLCFITPNSSEYEISCRNHAPFFTKLFPRTKNRMGVHVWNPDHVAM
jgi:hypothetical protein